MPLDCRRLDRRQGHARPVDDAACARTPGYGFERHKGYGTPEHKAALARLGVSAEHRRSFKPIQLALGLVAAEEAAE